MPVKRLESMTFLHVILTGCGGNFTARSGVITSQNYPNNYPHGTDCAWLITVEQGHTVTFTFEDLDLEADGGCSFDYVTVSGWVA